MPYVRRNADGKIVALLLDADDDAQEQLGSGHPEVIAFLGEGRSPETFSALDLDFVRVTEDLIHTLIEKGVLQFTDLPDEAQRKLRARESFRNRRITDALDLIGGSDLY